MKYTVEQRVQIISLYYQNDESARKTYKALRKFFKPTDRPSEQTIYRLKKKFESTGSVIDIKPSVRARSGRSPGNIAAVRESVLKDPTMSLSRRSKLLGISQTTLCRILTEDLGLRLTSSSKEIITETVECNSLSDSQQGLQINENKEILSERDKNNDIY